VSLELRIDSTIFRIQDIRAIGLYWPIPFLGITETLTWSHWGGILPLSQSLFKIFKRIRMTWGGIFLRVWNVVQAWSCVFLLNSVIQFRKNYREEEEFGIRGLVR